MYAVETYPENQIPPERILMANRHGEIAIDLSLNKGIWEFNGDF